MDEKTMALARRAVASKHWRWMPGMKTLCGCRIVCVAPPGDRTPPAEVLASTAGHGPRGVVHMAKAVGPELLPDFRDSATVGCLAHLGWECHQDLTVWPVSREHAMAVWTPECVDLHIEVMIQDMEKAP